MAARELYNRTAIVFLGAGASMGDESERESGRGLLGSGGLTKALAAEFNIDLEHDSDGNLLSGLRKTSSLAVKKRDESTVKRFVIDQVRPRCGASLKAHKILASLQPHTVITTNYDDLYESAWRELDKELEKVVSPRQLPRIPQDSPRLLKLHGDIEAPNEIILTRDDYRKWQREAGGFQNRVVATLQESVCIFVGYGVGDENLHDILNVIEGNLGNSSLKHFALVHSFDEALAAEWDGIVEFVSGDATHFLERVASEHRDLGPQPFNPATARKTFEQQLKSGDLPGAGKTCEELAEHFEKRGERATSGALWRSFGKAAKEASEHGSAAAAFKRGGVLFLRAGYEIDAEPILAEGLGEAQADGATTLEREIQPFLQQARLASGMYHEVLGDAERALTAYGDDAPASLKYSLRAARAEARGAMEGPRAARAEFEAALKVLGSDDLYFRVRAGMDLARTYCEEFDWTAAHDVLNDIGIEVLNARGSLEHDEGRRLEAMLKLVRANVHLALGEDVYASVHYRECAPVLEELQETDFAASALQGMVVTAPHLGYMLGEETAAHLRDLARASDSHRRCTDLQRQGIEQLADDKLAAARESLVQAEATAQALHSPTRSRSIGGWFADVLLKAEFRQDAVMQYAQAGDRKKVKKVVRELRDDIRQQDPGSLPPIEQLLELVRVGPLHSRGPAYTGLQNLWDVIPESLMPEIATQLASLQDMPSDIWAERSVLPEASEFARLIASRLTLEQAEQVGMGLVVTINEEDVSWTSHKAACRALANLVGRHPGLVGSMELPVERLAQLAGQDLLNDRVLALMALVNLGHSGHSESRRRALELLDAADTYTRTSWRQILGEATEEETVEAIRELLPHSVSRVRSVEGGESLGLGMLDPLFLKDWDLPDQVRLEVAQTLSQAVGDSEVALTHRQAAALALGHKVSQFDADERREIVESLKTLLSQPFAAHPMLQSTDNPLSMLQMNVGKPEDVTSAAVWALLAFSPWVQDEQDRLFLRREVERLRASQVEEQGIGVAEGLAWFEPSSDEERQWLITRILLLLNSQHSRVRQGCARSAAFLLKHGQIPLDAELVDTLVHLSTSNNVDDRRAAASALKEIVARPESMEVEAKQALDYLRSDPSYLVRGNAGEES